MPRRNYSKELKELRFKFYNEFKCDLSYRLFYKAIKNDVIDEYPWTKNIFEEQRAGEIEDFIFSGRNGEFRWLISSLTEKFNKDVKVVSRLMQIKKLPMRDYLQLYLDGYEFAKMKSLESFADLLQFLRFPHVPGQKEETLHIFEDTTLRIHEIFHNILDYDILKGIVSAIQVKRKIEFTTYLQKLIDELEEFYFFYNESMRRTKQFIIHSKSTGNKQKFNARDFQYLLDIKMNLIEKRWGAIFLTTEADQVRFYAFTKYILQYLKIIIKHPNLLYDHILDDTLYCISNTNESSELNKIFLYFIILKVSPESIKPLNEMSTDDDVYYINEKTGKMVFTPEAKKFMLRQVDKVFVK